VGRESLAPTNLGGLGFSMKWNMGWMKRHAGLHQPRSRSPQLSPPRDDVSRCSTHSARTSWLPISHDRKWCTGKGNSCGAGCPANDHMKAAGFARPCWRTSGHTRESSLLFMARNSVSRGGNGPTSAAVDWFQLGEGWLLQRAILRYVPRHQPDLQRTAGHCGHANSSPEGYSWIDANDSANNVLSFLRFR